MGIDRFTGANDEPIVCAACGLPLSDDDLALYGDDGVIPVDARHTRCQPPSLTQRLRLAIAARRVVQLQVGSAPLRVVEPWRVEGDVLMAWDRAAEDMRRLRISAYDSVVVTEETYAPTAHDIEEQDALDWCGLYTALCVVAEFSQEIMRDGEIPPQVRAAAAAQRALQALVASVPVLAELEAAAVAAQNTGSSRSDG